MPRISTYRSVGNNGSRYCRLGRLIGVVIFGWARHWMATSSTFCNVFIPLLSSLAHYCRKGVGNGSMALLCILFVACLTSKYHIMRAYNIKIVGALSVKHCSRLPRLLALHHLLLLCAWFPSWRSHRLPPQVRDGLDLTSCVRSAPGRTAFWPCKHWS